MDTLVAGSFTDTLEYHCGNVFWGVSVFYAVAFCMLLAKYKQINNVERVVSVVCKWRTILKVFVVLLAVLAAMETGRLWMLTSTGWPPTIAAVFYVASSFAALVLHVSYASRANSASDILLIYWPASTTVSLLVLHFSLKVSLADRTARVLCAGAVYIVLGMMAFILELKSDSLQQSIFLADNERSDNSTLDRIGSNIITRLAFRWVTPAVTLGYKNQMFSEEQMFNVPRALSGEQANEEFFENWRSGLKSPSPVLLKVLYNGIRHEIVISGCLLLTSTSLQLLQPLILQQIIKFFHGYGTDSGRTLGDGLFLAFSMGVVEVVRAVTYQRYWHILMKSYLWLLKVLSALVYRKVLHLSNKSKTQHTTGELVSYQSVDIENLTLAVNYVHCLWDYPLRIIVILSLLYWNIGWSCFAGVAIVVLGAYLGTLVLKYVKVHVAELFENRDERMRLVSKMLTNVKSIKLYSWQNLFLRKIDSLRNRKELSALRKLAASNGMLTFVSSLTTVSVGVATFAVYEILDGTSHGPLTSQLIFALLSLFVLIREPITEGMTAFSVLINAHRSYLRISSLALSEEVGSNRVGLANHICGSSVLRSKEAIVKVKNGTFGWLSSDEPSLTDINIECKRDELVAVVGRVGSGKSSLVSAVLGDMVKIKGSVTVQGSIAYVPQQAWIMNATLRDNILFGHRLDQELYDKVIDACALRPDLEMLPSGNMTEIGEKGINLSGGQRARVSLARAVYACADVYILDDPLAAVDAHVGKHLYSHVIGPNGLLKSRARILVTNAVQYLNTANSIYMLENGRIVDHGTVAEVIERKSRMFGLFTQTLNEHNCPPIDRCSISSDQDPEPVYSETAADKMGHISTKVASAGSDSAAAAAAATTVNANLPFKIVKDEEKILGSIGWNTIRFYMGACGRRSIGILLVAISLSLTLNAATGVWIAHWADSNDMRKSDKHGGSTRHLLVYGMLGLASSVVVAAGFVILRVKCTIVASTIIHKQILRSIVESPMSFFDSTPLGRILGLFSGDQAQIDDNVSVFLGKSIEALTQIAITLALIILPAPASLVFLLPLAIAFSRLYAYFIPTTRDARRIISRKRNIAISTTEEALCGAESIRAYGQGRRFEKLYSGQIEEYMMASWTYFCTNRWLAIRLDMISACTMFCTAALLAVLQSIVGGISGSQVGLALTYALSIVGVLNVGIRNMSFLELAFISVERARQYSILLPEADEIIENNRPKESWPEQGMVEFKNYSTRYREGLDLILKDLTFRVMPRQKVGIVGRTGAGKSSLTLALFRIIEAAEGKILIDGKDIFNYGLFDVRSKLSIIPQDPVLFAGTVRENLDPFGSYPDQEIWNALQHAHLAEYIRTKEEGLEFEVMQNGSNFSVGQRQLICLARALLKRAKVLVLDEATAAIDNSTDAIIQESIRKEFKDCTVLTIAHRLNTIIDSDMILALDNGKIAEYDTPQNLLDKRDSLFFKLVEEAGINGHFNANI